MKINTPNTFAHFRAENDIIKLMKHAYKLDHPSRITHQNSFQFVRPTRHTSPSFNFTFNRSNENLIPAKKPVRHRCAGPINRGLIFKRVRHLKNVIPLISNLLKCRVFHKFARDYPAGRPAPGQPISRYNLRNPCNLTLPPLPSPPCTAFLPSPLCGSR